jgi:hypothetical protein
MTKASWGTVAWRRRWEPAGVVCEIYVCIWEDWGGNWMGRRRRRRRALPDVLSLSFVAMLFLTRMGIPWRGLEG